MGCKGFSYHEQQELCIIRKGVCKRQPGRCSGKKKACKGYCFYAKGKVNPFDYKYYPLRGDCPGNKIRMKRGVSQSECEKACTKVDKCQGISYSSKEQRCVLKRKQCDHRQGSCPADKMCF